MNFLATLITTGLLVVTCVSGQLVNQEWTAYNYHNPQTMATDCGFPTNDAAYICDPNGVLAVPDLLAVNWILKDAVYNSTSCPCSTYYCEKQKIPKGYNIMVALVKRMEKQRDSDRILGREEMAKDFSRELKTKKWKMGGCDENIIIFYSIDDKTLSIDPGATAAQKLDSYFIKLLTKKIGGRLNDGHIIEALNVLIYDIKIILNCDLENRYDCTIYERGVASSFQASFISFMTLVTLFMVYWINW